MKKLFENWRKHINEGLEDTTPQTIADFAWDEGIRIIDFGDPDKEPKLSSDDKKRIAQIIADEAAVEINSWGDATDRNITLDFKKFESKVFSALWHKHKKAADAAEEAGY